MDVDSDPRQHTLRATIDWSHDLLEAEEKQVLRRLSVFASGSTFDAAERVAGADPEAVQSLIDKSLLRRRDATGGPRYWLLETIRQYALEQLDKAGETHAIRDRHLEWILDHVRANAPVYVRPADPARVDLLMAEEEETFAAVSWAITRGNANDALELCSRMGRAWVETGRWTSGRASAQSALELGTGSPELVAGSLLTAGMLGWHLGIPGVDQQVRAARSEFELLGLHWEGAVATMILGMRLAESGELDRGITLVERSIAAFEILSDSEGTRVARGSLADALSRRAVTPDELRNAATLIEETLELDRAAGDLFDEIAGLSTLSEVLLRLDEPESARAAALRAAGIAKAIGCASDARSPRCRADRGVSGGGTLRQALRLAAAVDPISRELGQPISEADRHRVATARQLAEPHVDRGIRMSALASGSTMTPDALLEYLVALD